MNSTSYNPAVNANASVRLPPINGGIGETGGGARSTAADVNKPGMVSNASNSQALIYRSIPPKPQNFTLTDMLGSAITPPTAVKSKKLGLSGNTPSEFAKRFMTRPSTQPKVIEFNVGRIKADKHRRGINGFFPPVKLRLSAKSQPAPSVEPPPTAARLQLVPTSFSEVRPRSSSRSMSRSSRQSRQSMYNRKTPESVRTAPPTDVTVVYPETFDCDDLSYLPPPKRILPKRDTPWVFRYKVKKNMNELSKIMASKPQHLIDV